MRRRECLGFSLIEVTLAIALVAFAVVALLGMIPAGLGWSRESINETRSAEIASQVFSTIRKQPFSATELCGSTVNFSAILEERATVHVRLSADETGGIRQPVAGDLYNVTVSFSPRESSAIDDGLVEARVNVRWSAVETDRMDFATLVSRF